MAGEAATNACQSYVYSFAEAAALAIQGIDETAPPQENQITDSLTEALKALREGSGALQEPIVPDGLTGMFSGLGLDDVSTQIPN